MSEYLIQRETLTALCDAYRSLLLVEDTSLIGIEALTSFIGTLPIKIYHLDSVLSIEEGVLTVDLPISFFSGSKETTIIIKTTPINYILSFSCINKKNLCVQHGSSQGFGIYAGGTTMNQFLSIDTSSTSGYNTVTWNVTDSFYPDVYNSTAELWVVTKS